MGENGQINDSGRFFFSFKSGVQPGLSDLINLSLSREPERWIQLRLARQENGTGGLLMVLSSLSSLGVGGLDKSQEGNTGIRVELVCPAAEEACVSLFTSESAPMCPSRMSFS